MNIASYRLHVTSYGLQVVGCLYPLFGYAHGLASLTMTLKLNIAGFGYAQPEL